MRRDGVGEEAVRACLDLPEATTATIKERTNSWCKHNDEYLRITAIEESGYLVIISVALRRKGPAK
jgi:hypothetical protein